jgi:hypothetical protein
MAICGEWAHVAGIRGTIEGKLEEIDEMKLTTEQIECAVNWWREALKEPRVHSGDIVSDAIVSYRNAREGYDLGQIETFVSVLRIRLEAEFEEDDIDDTPRLMVDYEPKGILEEIANETLYEGHFPWKTRMLFKDGGVQAKRGYGAEMVEILKLT